MAQLTAARLTHLHITQPPAKATGALRTVTPGDNTSPAVVRVFDSGANRDTDEGKYDPEGFLSPAVLERFFAYMHQHRYLKDGTLRDSDNWQKGIPREAYVKSLWRHFFDVWDLHRGSKEVRVRPDTKEVVDLESALCALMFNAMGLLHEVLKNRDVGNKEAA